ncbi:MAG: prolyl oligopeptidase family serine peptidase [Bacteroidales bacterium]
MTKKIFLYLSLSLLLAPTLNAQSYRNKSSLKLEDIMKGEEWMGYMPDDARWSPNGNMIYFTWNPEKELLKPDYGYNVETGELQKLSTEQKKQRIPSYGLSYNNARDQVLYTKGGDLYLYNVKDDVSLLLLDLSDNIDSPFWSVDELSIFYSSDNNLYKYTPSEGKIEALTLFKQGSEKFEKKKFSNDQEEWLYKDQRELFDILKQDEKKDSLRSAEREELKPDQPLEIYTGDARVFSIGIDKAERFITFIKFNRDASGKNTEMPKYVTETGFTEMESVRAKVGYAFGSMELGIYDRENDTVYNADISDLPGIKDYWVFEEDQSIEVKDDPKKVYMSSPVWSDDRSAAIINLRSTDNKDRWICLIDLETGKLKNLDHQRDEAWIAGPGIGWSTSSGTLGWIDNQTIYFQSEESGYSHLYSYDFEKEKKKQLTKGDFVVYDPKLSNDKQYFYFSSNEEHYGERHFYRMDVDGGKRNRLTFIKGSNEVSLSPDESKIVVRYSYANEPWELYIADLDVNNPEDVERIKITDSYSEEFREYEWRVPEFIRFKASDGEMVPARLYRPDPDRKNGAGVIFVHGAGYLQNAHKWWSNYYREYMFHNFLVDNGYTLLDIDYRGSAGYGCDWRTAIYRHMGGKDLSDNVDGASYLVNNEDIDPERVGIYGGSYGGFITLMAMFTSPGTFEAGAALRPVTDWAHYNHGYTSNILNTPVEDSLAYRRSSPIYYADGLEGHLVMCHGMLDDNVHFQDVVRLSQRLIELQKDNWELAAYPIEPHSFNEWTSWLDEYKRIYRIFESNLAD